MFETFDVPAMYLARQPQLAAFSTGRASGIVVDLGHACTRVTPLYDGYIIQSEQPLCVARAAYVCPEA